MALVHGWNQGQASNCQSLGCSTVSGGLFVCQNKCLNNPYCNVINFCPAGADCKSGLNRCCLRRCDNGDFKLTNKWKGWDIYVKGMASTLFRYCNHSILFTTCMNGTEMLQCIFLSFQTFVHRV